MTANGYAVLMNRSNVQHALHEFVTFYQNRVAAYQANGAYPMNGPVEIRVTGLDNADDIGLSDAGAGQLSALRPRPDHPEWDVAVWFDILTVPGTPTANQFYREIEQWLLTNYSGSYAMVRPEWSKGWGVHGHRGMVGHHHVELDDSRCLPHGPACKRQLGHGAHDAQSIRSLSSFFLAAAG